MLPFLYPVLDLGPENVYLLPDRTLVFGRGELQPILIELRKNAGLPRQPSIPESFQTWLVLDILCLIVNSCDEFRHGAIERFRRVVLEFGDGVHVVYRASEAAVVVCRP